MSVQERDASILRHIISYCEQIQMAITHFGDDYALFESDPVFRNAVALCILQIGELVGILSDEFRSAHPGIPWRQIKQMRNIVAHKYGSFDASITWDVVQNDIPNLQAFCTDVLK